MGGTKYTKDRQLEIGKEIFNHEYTVYTAASRYDVSPYTARDYLRRYKAKLITEGLDDFEENEIYAAYKSLTKDELIVEIHRLREELKKQEVWSCDPQA